MNARTIDGIGMTSQRTRSRLVQRLAEQGISSKAVLSVMERVPRHLFVDEALAHRAYEDKALPIGHNQTLSQPYIVARMTAMLLVAGPMRKVLEIGTGSGYQTAVLAALVQQVYSIECIRSLHDKAKMRLQTLSLRNIQLKRGDGYAGWKGAEPFDGIIVTAAPPKIPSALLEQLSPHGGRLVIPVGQEGETQQLTVITKKGDRLRQHVLEPVRFVPMVT